MPICAIAVTISLTLLRNRRPESRSADPRQAVATVVCLLLPSYLRSVAGISLCSVGQPGAGPAIETGAVPLVRASVRHSARYPRRSAGMTNLELSRCPLVVALSPGAPGTVRSRTTAKVTLANQRARQCRLVVLMTGTGALVQRVPQHVHVRRLCQVFSQLRR